MIGSRRGRADAEPQSGQWAVARYRCKVPCFRSALTSQTRKGTSCSVAFIDSTLLAVCHPNRASRPKVFAGLAQWGRSSVGWSYGFKLHLLINDERDLLAVALTPANVDDRRPVPALVQGLTGKLFGDRGSISRVLFEDLFARGLALITKLRKNMKNKLVPLLDKLLLRKRALVETVNDQLRNISQIEHSCHRCRAPTTHALLSGKILAAALAFSANSGIRS
jgi:DDE family transposase